MDIKDRLSSTESHGLVDDETIVSIEVISKEKELPLRLYVGNGPRNHKKLSIEYGVADKRCEQCGQALRRVTKEELNMTCEICNERGHIYLDCDLPVMTQKQTEVPRQRRTVHCGLCGEAGH
ncbi:hypothetical protein VNO78_15360 [Psophocarpus tetragonolobus]|uniref:Uncharacterized protein n=1 Tax=Psophocarpus tetragonolobus TaxID=3891 RepID=A0AAN9SF77_PSOTE